MKERIAVPTNAKEGDIQIGKDRAKITRNYGPDEEAGRSERVAFLLYE
jgi:hypothetical protein